MKISRNKLVGILSSVRAAMAKSKSTEEHERCFIFDGESITCYSDNLCISHPMKTNFECLVPAEEFHKILERMETNEIELSYSDDDEKLSIRGGRTKAAITTIYKEEMFDLVNLLELDKISKKFKSLPKDFLEAIKLCSFSVSTDVTQPALTCIHVADSFVTSSDDLRISVYNMESKVTNSFMLPGKSAIELIKFDVTKYAVTENHVFFTNKEGLIFCARTMNLKYPEDCHKNFEFKGKKVVLPDQLQSDILSASILAEGEDIEKRITVTIEGNKIKCKGKNDVGWITTTLDITTKENLQFTINPNFFVQILDKTNKVEIGKDRVLFKTDKFKHLVALYNDKQGE